MEIGFLIFPGMLQLDFTGAYGVLAAGPEKTIHLIWKNMEPICSSDGLPFYPTSSMDSCPDMDVILVPGGAGILPLLEDDETLTFLRNKAEKARYVTSVCTGSLVLGAAGLLHKVKATTHWLSLSFLAEFGALPQHSRIVQDGKILTAAGVTSGIDMALLLAALLWGEECAQSIQLGMEYAPEPPFQSGSPASAPEKIRELVQKKNAARQEERQKLVKKAAARLLRSLSS